MAESRPETVELAKLEIPELLARYGTGVENFDRRVFELSDDQLDMAFLPDAGVGRWPVRVLLGHLADAELMQTARIRRAIVQRFAKFGERRRNALIAMPFERIQQGAGHATGGLGLWRKPVA